MVLTLVSLQKNKLLIIKLAYKTQSAPLCEWHIIVNITITLFIIGC